MMWICKEICEKYGSLKRINKLFFVIINNGFVY